MYLRLEALEVDCTPLFEFCSGFGHVQVKFKLNVTMIVRMPCFLKVS